MTQDSTFSDVEWTDVKRLPLYVAAMVSAVDYSSVSEGREYRAYAAFIQKAAGKRHRSTFLKDVIEDIDEIDLPAFQDHCQAVTGALGGENPVDQCLSKATEISKMLDARLPKKTAQSYKNFIMDVAVAVARAHKESIVPLGSAISATEGYHIRRLGQALGL